MPEIKTIGGANASTAKAPTMTAATPKKPRRMICKVKPWVTAELNYACSNPDIDLVAYTVTPRQCNPTPGFYTTDPHGCNTTIAAAGKLACPILIPLTEDGLGLPAHAAMTPGAMVTMTNGKTLPRPNDPAYVAFMVGFASAMGVAFRNDAKVGLVRVCGFQVMTNEPAGYGNGTISGWAALRSQLSAAAIVPIGTPPIPGFQFDASGTPILDGSDTDGMTKPYLDILDAWYVSLGVVKMAATIKFDGGSEAGFRTELRAYCEDDGILALNTGFNDAADHANCLDYAAAHPFGWGGVTMEDPGKGTGLTGLPLREYAMNACIPLAGPPVRCWQAERDFWELYPTVTAEIAKRLVW